MEGAAQQRRTAQGEGRRVVWRWRSTSNIKGAHSISAGGGLPSRECCTAEVGCVGAVARLAPRRPCNGSGRV
eukprot:3087115-Pyramimonas_sp.AAC.1